MAASSVSGSRGWIALGAFVAILAAVAVIGGQFTPANDPAWYAALKKPWFNPPNWVFAPVWTALYVMIAVSGWLVWRSGPWHAVRGALALWAVQLALNAAWTPLFFGAHRLDLAVVDIAALVVAIVATIAVFRRHSGAAAWLLVPYLAWVCFAALLTVAIWRLNP